MNINVPFYKKTEVTRECFKEMIDQEDCSRDNWGQR